MALTSEADGTQLAVISTEHTLFTGSDTKSYMVYIDTTNMQSGDTTEIRVKVIINSVLITVLFSEYTNASTNAPLSFSPPVPSSISSGWRVTLKHTVGTGRNYDWRIYSV